MDFSLFDLLSWYLVFLFSLVAHEASHALAAWKLGDSTAYDGGQVTLDPTPHIKREPWGTVVVPLVAFISNGWMIGWASAPYNRMWARLYPKRAALMALAGPVANIIIVIIAFALMKAGLAADIFTSPDSASLQRVVVSTNGGWAYAAAQILSIAFSLNLILFLFNLLPLPPLDGSSIIKLVLPDSVQAKYDDLVSHPAAAWGGILAAWYFFPTVGFPLLGAAIRFVS
jgi:Zn-dependent protease